MHNKAWPSPPKDLRCLTFVPLFPKTVYSLSDERGKKIVKFLRNFRPHMICTSISQPQHENPIPPTLYISLSRAQGLTSLLCFWNIFLLFHDRIKSGSHWGNFFTENMNGWLLDLMYLFFFLSFFLLDYKGPDLEEGWRMNYIMGVAVAACICTVFLIVMCTVKLYARNNPSYRNLQSSTK